MISTKIKIKLKENKNACAQQNIRNIQILNIIEQLQNDKSIININEILKTPETLEGNRNISLYSKMNEAALIFLQLNISKNRSYNQLVKTLTQNPLTSKETIEYIKDPKVSIELSFHKSINLKSLLAILKSKMNSQAQLVEHR